MAERLRVGLLGVGGVAAKYAALYAEYPRSDLRCVFDPDPVPARALAERFGCAVAPSAADVIAADIDAVVISTPNFLHFAQAKSALAAGRHVLLQKPMTLDVREAEELTRAAAASGRVLAMYMNSLDHPVMRDVKRMIADGVLGRVGAYDAKLANGMGHVWAKQPPNFWRGSRKAVGGGSFAMLATHYVNLGQWLLGSPIVEATARADNLMCGHIEGDDIMAALVRFDGGAIGVIASAWCVKGEQMSVHGSDGFVSYVDNAVVVMKGARPFHGEVLRYDTPGVRAVIGDLHPPAMGDWRNPHNQHRRFVDAILDGHEPEVPAAVGLHDMRVLEAAYRSVESGRRESVSR